MIVRIIVLVIFLKFFFAVQVDVQLSEFVSATGIAGSRWEQGMRSARHKPSLYNIHRVRKKKVPLYFLP